MAHFPAMFRKLPEADLPVPGVVARLLRGPTASAIFWETAQDTQVPEHRHGDQWGVVLEGEVRLTIGGRAQTFRRGDEYFVPAGTPHSADLKAGARVIDVFDDPDRYRARA